MPSKKKKYNARFPPGRIKKIMQTDEDVGKVAQAVPIIISRTLELFVHSLLTKTMQITSAKQAKTLSPSHMKQCILSESRFDFLKDLVKGLPDISGADDDIQTPPSTPVIPVNNIPVTSTYKTETDTGSNSQIISRRRSTDKSNKSSKLPEQSGLQENESINTSNIPKFNLSVPSSFNANQPNFYTEVNADTEEAKNNAGNQSVLNFSCTANIDEDYDT